MKQAVRVLVWTIALLVTAAAVFTWKGHVEQVRRLGRYEETTGTVVGLTRQTWVSSSKQGGRRNVTVDVPLIEYRTPSGTERGNPIYFDGDRPFSVGGQVVVYFDPQKPRAFVMSVRAIPPTMPIVLTCFAIAWGVLAFRLRNPT